MKTFIWNTEYEVLLANAENVEDARQILFKAFVNSSRVRLIDDKDRDKIKDNAIPSYVLSRAESIINSDVWTLLEAFKREPDTIVEMYKGIIYNHANE